jgi:AGCS family alanine or glycine:cation symporter
LPGFGGPFIAIALLFFAFTTIMAYYYMAETNLAYLNRSVKRVWADYALKFSILFFTFYGCIKTAKLAWGLGDVGVGSMAWLNIIAILLLTKPALKVLKDYERQRVQGIDPVFDPKRAGIANAHFWENEYDKSEEKRSA